MSLWTWILVASACGGAFLLWHAVSRTKATTEEMLRHYSDLLADARQRKAQELAQRAADAEEEQQAEE